MPDFGRFRQQRFFRWKQGEDNRANPVAKQRSAAVQHQIVHVKDAIRTIVDAVNSGDLRDLVKQGQGKAESKRSLPVPFFLPKIAQIDAKREQQEKVEGCLPKGALLKNLHVRGRIGPDD